MSLTTHTPWRRQDLDAVIVDLDGTMVDTLGDFVQALQRMLGDLPEPYASFLLDKNLVERCVGKGSEHLIKSVLAHIEPAQAAMENVALYEMAWASYQRHYPVVNGHYSTVYPGVVQGLDALQRAGLAMVCVTNKPTAFARALLADKVLASYFRLVSITDCP